MRKRKEETSLMLNETDQTLHDEIHTLMLKQDPRTLLNNPRLKILDKLSNDLKVDGVVADVGCGSGYFGIGLAKKFPNIKRIDCIEASKSAVDELIPRNIKFYGLESRIKPVHGSFDDLGSETYDAVFVMGALHHSQDLKKTLNSISKALKPNGVLVAQEPAMPDDTTHTDYKFKYDIIEERFGLKIRNGDRFDRFFRECEYKYCLIINGFDIFLWDDFNSSSVNPSKFELIKKYLSANGYKKTLSKIVYSLFKIKEKNYKSESEVWKQNMQKALTKLKPKIIVAKKSECKEVFHNKPF